MLGAIIGDIVGSCYEFNPTNDYNFKMFADGSGFTDDTVCTIAIADAILKRRDYGECLHEWCRKYPNPKGGYGSRFAQWVKSDNPKPYNSFGNGSAMRVSPFGWLFDRDNVVKEARKSAECTHNHEEGIKGAESVAIAIHDCLQLNWQNVPASEILQNGLDTAIKYYDENPDNFKVDLRMYRNKFDETCQGTVPVALWIVKTSTSFEDVIRKAVSLGADADTLGAIAGSIAEAIWGIPEWMKEKALTFLPKEMTDVIADFRNSMNE